MHLYDIPFLPLSFTWNASQHLSGVTNCGIALHQIHWFCSFRKHRRKPSQNSNFTILCMWESFFLFLLMLFFSIYYWPLLPFFFCTMAHVFIYCAPHPFRERVFQTPTMRRMIRTGIIFIATQTLSNSALPHIQNKEILLEKDEKKYFQPSLFVWFGDWLCLVI